MFSFCSHIIPREMYFLAYILSWIKNPENPHNKAIFGKICQIISSVLLNVLKKSRFHLETDAVNRFDIVPAVHSLQFVADIADVLFKGTLGAGGCVKADFIEN